MNSLVNTCTEISGIVFEDVNYGGGIGRDRIVSSGIPVESAIVEIYNNAGTLIQTTTTDAAGQYIFGAMADGTYNIRVVNSSVRSSRTGGSTCVTCIPVQTFRKSFAASTLSDITNEVGGANPSGEDSSAGSLTGAQSVASVTISNESAIGLDFGFNFNTIVNTNDENQGSLAQFVVNANNLGNTGLNIVANSIFDPAAGEDVSIFMIPPTADPLGRTADVNYAAGVFRIDQDNANPIPIALDPNTHIDGRTQTAYSGDTNVGTLGLGGTNVGVSSTVLPIYNLPEIEIFRVGGDVFIIQADNTVVRNVYGHASNQAVILVESGNNILITENQLDIQVSGSSTGNSDHCVEVTGGTSTISGNYMTGDGESAITINGGTSTIIQFNHIEASGNTPCEDGVSLKGGSGILIQYNLINNSEGIGIDGELFVGAVIIDENTITNSGQSLATCSGTIENNAVRLFGNNSSITKNVLANNGGAGIVIAGGNTSGNLISQNSIYNNGTTADALGIDIDQSATGNPAGDGVTLNDNGDVDLGPNQSLNLPVFKGPLSIEILDWLLKDGQGQALYSNFLYQMYLKERHLPVITSWG